ncbi:DUF4097 family beta strand repeat-containing protein [Micromonospora sp. WMMD1120]|uniref:DUF4097 family beta strand repeat-containing protein n=1 Tax=Micromonospora sp. WMMD1120 TaxID=3016106 RepID=UPI002415BECD|nr:DUF4097 family beta strand repeat-containing protein [Micromonospora sp. WMMD1120]MDG4805666.1 DUF4097 family beta strand repeat-containing protein [Micromonospora sp. WMMD1120]
MALHRTISPRFRRVVTPVALGLATTLIVLSGCDNLAFRRLDYDNTEAVRITTVRVSGGAGDVVIRGTGPASEARIKRVVRYQGSEPDDARYEIKGSELLLDTDCGSRCAISYEVTVPEGVTVRGETSSGNVELSRVGAVDLQVSSGDVRVSGASGALGVETRSGNIEVSEASAEVRLRASSGDITARRLGGTVDAEASSGNVNVELDKPASARVHASSGDVTLLVPEGSYQVRSSADSGDKTVTVADNPAATLVLDGSANSGNLTISER